MVKMNEWREGGRRQKVDVLEVDESKWSGIRDG